MGTMLTDLIQAWRALARRPQFALLTAGTMAVGLGATIAMFAIVDAVLLRPLPFPRDHELVAMTEKQAARGISGVSIPAVGDWRSFPELQSVAFYEPRTFNISTDGASEHVNGMSVSPGFFSTLGVTPSIGRVMSPADPMLDPAPKIVLSQALWRRAFNSDSAVVGRSILLEQKPFTVIGVMPAGFSFPAGSEFWTTLPTSMRMLADDRSLRFVDVIARMKEGTTLAALRTRLDEWKRRDATVDPRGQAWLPLAMTLRDDAVGAVKTPLLIVSGGVWLLLAVACVNAVALVLAQGRAKMRDLAVQAALGAHRGRLVRQLVLEGALLSVAGAAAGLVIAALARDGIVALSENQIPRVAEVAIGARTLLFALGAGVITTLAVALGPALAITRQSHAGMLQSGGRAVSSSAGRRWFGPLVAVEFALALVLASAAGLLIASYARLKSVDTGFDARAVAAVRVEIPLTPAWTSDVVRRQLHADLLARVRALPGVSAAGIVSRLPLSEVRGGIDVWAGGGDSAPADHTSPALLQLSSEGYLPAIGAQFVAGRDLSESDAATAPGAAVINEVLARRLWPDRSPIGQQLSYQFMRGLEHVTIVGVVKPMRYNDLAADLRGEIFISFRQHLNTPSTLVFKSSAEPLTLMPSVRRALADVDHAGGVALADAAALDTQLSRTLARPRFFLVFASVFGGVALLLAALGIYGTMMFWVGERWRELGIRVALGATRGRVVRLVIWRGLAFAAAGVGTGLVVAIAGRQAVASLLFQVPAGDPRVLAATAVLLGAAAAGACALPARRVARVDPVITLKGE